MTLKETRKRQSAAELQVGVGCPSFSLTSQMVTVTDKTKVSLICLSVRTQARVSMHCCRQGVQTTIIMSFMVTQKLCSGCFR